MAWVTSILFHGLISRALGLEAEGRGLRGQIGVLGLVGANLTDRFAAADIIFAAVEAEAGIAQRLVWPLVTFVFADVEDGPRSR